jgi:toxin ParE1/3/4
MIEVRILPLARERLLEIWDYTSKKWDDDQADSYVNALISHINDVARDRLLWRAVKETRMNGAYFVRYRHHYIFFREFAGFIGVIRILHENMDIPNRLKEDDTQGS